MLKNVLLFFHHHKILIHNNSFGSIYDTVNFNAQFAALLKRKDEKTLPMCPVGIELQSQLQSNRNKIDLKLKLHDCNHIIIPCFNHLYSCMSFLSFSLSIFLPCFLAPSLRFILSVCGSSLYPIPLDSFDLYHVLRSIDAAGVTATPPSLQDWWDAKLPEQGVFSCLSVIPKVLLAGAITLMDEAYYKLAVWLNDKGNSMVGTDADGWDSLRQANLYNLLHNYRQRTIGCSRSTKIISSPRWPFSSLSTAFFRSFTSPFTCAIRTNSRR